MIYKDLESNKAVGRDLIKFRFEAINNDNLGEDDTNVILFRAFLSGISDNFKGGWKPQKYAGRAENFWTYDDFGRDFAFKFKIAAQTRSEMKPLYQKLNYLKSLTAPDYHPDTGFMRGSFVRLTIGNWLYRQIGILTAVGSTIPDDSPWEIAIDEPENGDDKNMNELPHVVEVSISFTPIHDFLPKKDVRAGFLDLGRNGSANNWMDEDIVKKPFPTPSKSPSSQIPTTPIKYADINPPSPATPDISQDEVFEDIRDFLTPDNLNRFRNLPRR
jgi:hypothetical protein